VYHYDGKQIRRFLSGVWLQYLEGREAELKGLKQALPKPYPFLHVLQDAAEPKDLHVAIRGDAKNKGESAPRRFLAVLSPQERLPFSSGSGRLELAQAIASPDNPLTARVMANRIWQHHFGRGLVETADNFGRLGEAPTHPKLLDYLAAEFISSGWSIKALHRQIMLTEAYQRSSAVIDSNYENDPDNRLLWRFQPIERLDAEALRDSILAVAGKLDLTAGGAPKDLTVTNARRAVYGKVNRTNPDPTLTLFDFPDPKASASERSITVGPLQRLYFMNSPFVMAQAEALAERLAAEAGEMAADRIRLAYALLYTRAPSPKEIDVGAAFAAENDWKQYAQILLAASEFWTVQ
jgi:hypothetical protein